MLRPSLTVDLGAIADNWRALAALSGAAETAAVIKANAYGLGARQVELCERYHTSTVENGMAHV